MRMNMAAVGAPAAMPWFPTAASFRPASAICLCELMLRYAVTRLLLQLRGRSVGHSDASTQRCHTCIAVYHARHVITPRLAVRNAARMPSLGATPKPSLG